MALYPRRQDYSWNRKFDRKVVNNFAAAIRGEIDTTSLLCGCIHLVQQMRVAVAVVSKKTLRKDQLFNNV
jgi:hypothetical protein